MIKAIFFDIDGTLVDNRSIILDSTKEAIAAAKKQGIICGIATGRGPSTIKAIIKEITFDVYVVYNGQLAFTKDEIIVDQPFDKEVLQEIVTFADENHRQILFGAKHEIDGSMTLRLGQKKIIKTLAKFLPSKIPVRVLKRSLQKFSPNRRKTRYKELPILNKPIYQCMLFSAATEQPQLESLFPNCSFQRSNEFAVDIIPKGGSKLKGITAFAQAWGLSLEEIMAFGDHENDKEMLAGVGIGVAMGNSLQATKDAANYVTATNEEGGILHALKYFHVINE